MSSTRRSPRETPDCRHGVFAGCQTPLEVVERNCQITRAMMDTQLEVKGQLVANLEDIIDEQEARMFQLERSVLYNTSCPSSPRDADGRFIPVETRGARRIAAECGRLIEENRSLSEQLTAQQRRTRELEIEVGDMKKGAECVKSNLQPLIEKNKHLETNVSTALAQLAELQTERNLNAELTSEITNLRSKLEEIETEKLNKSEKIMRIISISCDKITQTSNAIDIRGEKLKQFQNELGVVKTETSTLKREVMLLVKNACDGMRNVCHQSAVEYAALLKQYKQEIALRRHYYNQLVEIRGNIRSICRVRPPINCEDRDSTVFVDQHDPSKLSVLNPDGRTRSFRVDCALGPTSDQHQVFSEVKQLISSCIDGYNVCIFAYGHTGSGKTYTMEGPPDKPGINKRALEQLFDEISHREQNDWRFSICVSLVEIYNEVIRDLLDVSKTKLGVRRDDDGRLSVPGLTEVPVTSVDDISTALQRGKGNRTTASTNSNVASSRSHGILRANLTAVHSTTNQSYFGRLNLVDLAGSERVALSGASGEQLTEARNINRSLSELGNVVNALKNKQPHVPFRNSQLTRFLEDSLSRLNLVELAGSERVALSGDSGEQLTEARNINRSLSELGNVVNALKNKQPHVPFRNSQLTRFLEDSLSGDSKTAVIVQVAPGKDNALESASSLAFAEKICRVELTSRTPPPSPASVPSRLSALNTPKHTASPVPQQASNLRRSQSMRKPSVRRKPSDTTF